MNTILYFCWIPGRDDHSQKDKVMRQNSPGQDDPGAWTWQCPLPTADLLASASFSVFSINTSWSMCERSCLLSNSSGYVQDEANVLVANDVWRSKVVLLLQATGAACSPAKQWSAPMCPGASQSWGGQNSRQPAALHFLRWEQSAEASDSLPTPEDGLSLQSRWCQG